MGWRREAPDGARSRGAQHVASLGGKRNAWSAGVRGVLHVGAGGFGEPFFELRIRPVGPKVLTEARFKHSQSLTVGSDGSRTQYIEGLDAWLESLICDYPGRPSEFEDPANKARGRMWARTPMKRSTLTPGEHGSALLQRLSFMGASLKLMENWADSGTDSGDASTVARRTNFRMHSLQLKQIEAQS